MLREGPSAHSSIAKARKNFSAAAPRDGVFLVKCVFIKTVGVLMWSRSSFAKGIWKELGFFCFWYKIKYAMNSVSPASIQEARLRLPILQNPTYCNIQKSKLKTDSKRHVVFLWYGIFGEQSNSTAHITCRKMYFFEGFCSQ